MPKPPDPSDDDMTTALAGLLPTGRVWPTGISTTIRKALSGLAVSFGRLARRSGALLQDAFPATTVELLPEWESSTGLPDPCNGETPTIESRRAQVVARVTNSGGQSVQYLIGYALALGYVITIEQFAPFRAGINRAGDPVNGVDWANTWAIHAALNQVEYFRAGIGAAGEPLAYWSNQVLECELRAISPAQTILQFRYS